MQLANIDYLYYLKSRHGWFLMLSGVFLLFVSFNAAGCLALADWWDGVWSERISPLLGVATFLVALAVWFAERHEEWKTSLPKKLTVYFRHEGKERMRCVRAELTAEADMRALAQQIGRQMNGGKDLSFFAPKLKPTGGDPTRDESGSAIRDYFITYELRECPDVVVESDVNSMLVWCPPFDNEPVLVEGCGIDKRDA